MQVGPLRLKQDDAVYWSDSQDIFGLNASLVRQWMDVELVWIIKNGTRMTGMPGYDQIHSDEEIVDLVRYLRSLGQSSDE